MVDVDVTSKEVVLRPRGLHRLWTFKREIRVPRSQLTSVAEGATDEAKARLVRSVRLPGTAVPFLITAGSFWGDGQWAFWDVVGKGGNAVTLSTEGNRYATLVIDVPDRSATLKALRAVVEERSQGA